MFEEIEKYFIFRDEILKYLYAEYPKEKYFFTADLNLPKYNMSIDSLSKYLYNSYNYVWVMLFLNPTLDTFDLGFKRQANNQQYIIEKTQYVFNNTNRDNIIDVFQRFYDEKENIAIFPYDAFKDAIVSKIENIYEALTK